MHPPYQRLRRRVSLALLALLLPATAGAQTSVLQGGPYTPGHVPTYNSSGSGTQPIVIDSGPAGGNTTGQGLGELNITARGTGTAPYSGQGTGPNGEVFCLADAVSTNATGGHTLCFSANALSGTGGLISYQAFGTAAALPLTFKVNGISYAFPFVLSGIVGPGTTVSGNFMCWNNTIGTLAKDCGYTTGTSGHAVPFVDGNNTYSGTSDFTGSTFSRNGTTEVFPGSGNIVGTTDVQTLTNKSQTAVSQSGTAITGASAVLIEQRAGAALSLFDFGGVCNGSTDDTTAFSAASTAGLPVSIPQNTTGSCVIKAGGSLTLTNPIIFLAGSTAISISNSTAVTLSKTPIASSQAQVFTVAAGSTVTFSRAGAEIFAEWFGAKADGSTASAAAFQLAVNSLTNGGTIQALAGVYSMACASGDAVTITNAIVNIYGSGNQSTVFAPATNCSHNIFYVNPSNGSGNLRDFLVSGAQIAGCSTACNMTAIYCNHCSVSDFTHLQFYGVKTAIAGYSVSNTKFQDIYIQYCNSSCMLIGGGTQNNSGTQVASIVMLDTINIFPNNTAANGLVLDSGANEIIVTRIEIGGASQGVTFQNTSSGGHKPENIRLFNSIIDASATCNVCFLSAWASAIRDSVIGTNSAGASVLINAAASKSDVDGVEITGNQIRNSFTDDIYIQQGANVFISANTIYAASSASGASTNTGNAIRVGANAVGSVDILNNMLGSEPVYANIASTQGRSVLLDSGSLANYTDGSSNLFTGRLSIQGNTMIGNAVAAITDSGTSATTKRIINNPGYNPVGASSLSVTASPMTYTAGASPEVVCVTGQTITSITIGGQTMVGAITATGACVPLAPQQAMILTYPGTAPTATKSVQ